MLDEDFTGLSVPTLRHTAAMSDKRRFQSSARSVDLGSNAHLDAQIQRSDSVLISHVFGPARQKNLRGVSLSVAAKQGSRVRRCEKILERAATSPAGEVQRRGPRHVWTVDVRSAVQKTQHRLGRHETHLNNPGKNLHLLPNSNRSPWQQR